MRLKKIELVGFKSFCDRTVVNFDESICAVVGPNGCGKSNIVDAIRWVLGEQSARHLRGRSMEDLIFAGSENRGPMGMAEVTLTLDLKDGVAPVRYLDYPEITVTRRVFRDGTSEYLIQKVPCRLKDISDIFLGTGVHSKAYSIIEQGRIGFILSSKPEERRILIEEAAGITKYKGKKKAAERRMKSTKQNLLRVNDIITELEKRLGSLRRQARKAERYEGYLKEFNDLDQRRLAHKFLELKVSCDHVQSELTQTQRESDDLSLSAETLEARLDAERLTLAESEAELNTLQEKVYEVENQVRLLENQSNYKEQERHRLSGEMERASGEIERLKEEMASLERDINVRSEELEGLEVGLEARRKELTDREAVAEEIRVDLEVCRADLEESRTAAAEHSKKVASSESRVETGKTRLEELEERLESVEIEVERLGEERSVLAPRRDELQERFQMEQSGLDEKQLRKERLTRHLESLREQHGDSEIRLETARSQLQKCRSRLGSLEEIQKRYEGFEQGTRAVMERYNGNAGEAGIRGLVADILSSPAELESAVEAVLGERLGNILVESQEVGVEAVTYLKEGRKGRSSFIPVQMTGRDAAGSAASGEKALQTMYSESWGGELQGVESVRGELTGLVEIAEGYDNVAQHLLGDVLVVEDLDTALTLWKSGKLFHKLVTLDGEIVDEGGVITGGSLEDKTAGVLGQKREIRELRKMARELEKVDRKSLARHMALRAEMGVTERELELLVDELHAADKALYACRRDLDMAAQRTTELDRRLQEGASERLRTAESLRREREEVDAAEKSGFHHSAELAKREEEVRMLSARVGVLAQRAEEANFSVTELKVGVAKSAEKMEALRAQLQTSRSGKKYAAEKVDDLTRSIEDSSQKREVLAQEIDESKKEASRLMSEAGEMDAKLSLLKKSCEQNRLACGELEAELKELRRHLADVNELRTTTEMAVQRLDMESGHLREEVAKRYHVSPEEILSDYHLEPPWDEQKHDELENLEGILERMRPYYNPTARREFDELSERHEFLSTQRSDLEEALDRLGKAIQKINRTSRKRFQETFDAVNERFQAVFPRLFNGGKASLLLTDSDDILEAGVEIAAQPPGKKLQSVALLSGGEKALTAVSLIFAIFLHHPSPFCILDEVDAPLDEANVDRYNSLVREIGLYTQFILVTHNKRTMEMVDALFGVTMDEPGVSRIVQVNLKDAAKVAA